MRIGKLVFRSVAVTGAVLVLFVASFSLIHDASEAQRDQANTSKTWSKTDPSLKRISHILIPKSSHVDRESVAVDISFEAVDHLLARRQSGLEFATVRGLFTDVINGAGILFTRSLSAEGSFASLSSFPHAAQVPGGFFETIFCTVSSFFGFPCDVSLPTVLSNDNDDTTGETTNRPRSNTPSVSKPGAIETRSIPPNKFQTPSQSTDERPITTINNTYPTTVIYKPAPISPSYAKPDLIVAEDYVTRSLFSKQVERIFDNIEDSIDSALDRLRTSFTTEALTLEGSLADSTDSIGSNGYVLKSTGSAVIWVATSTLGFGISNFSTSEIDTSYELAAIVTDETGTGRMVFSASPSFSGIATFSALTTTSTVSLLGTSANIALGSNYLSGDGQDEGIFVDSVGRVGIGTSSPSATLDISTPVDGTAINIKNTIDDTSWAEIGIEGSGNGFSLAVGNASETWYDIANSFAIYDWNDDAIRFAIDPTGNVGIGTTTPQEELTVVGDVLITDDLTVQGLADGCVEVSMGLLTSTGVNCGTGSGGVTSLNGLISSSQTFASSTSGTDFKITSSGSIHTFQLPSASLTARGLLTASAYTSFNQRVSTSSIDSLSEIETLTGVSNILIENDIDASSELLVLMDDETGTNRLVFSGSPAFSGTATFAGLTATGTATLTTVDINGGAIDGSTIGAASPSTIIGTTIQANTGFLPDTDGGAYLGQATQAFSGLFLDTGATINFDNSNAVLTHSSGILTVSTGDLRVTTAGTNSASVVTVGGTQTLTSKTLTAPTLTSPVVTGGISITGTATTTGNILPGANDTYDLGSTALRFKDLYLGGETLHLGTSLTDEATFGYTTSSNILNIGTDSTSNGDIAFFTDDLYLDKSTGNIGIGTTTPSAMLTVGATTNSQFNVTSAGVVSAGTWQGTAVADAYVSDAITISGGTIGSNNISGTLTTTGTFTIGDGGDVVNVNSSSWDVTSGAFSGITTLSMSGALTGATGYNGLVVTANTGVVTTGTWQGTAIDITRGGLGAAFTDPNADQLMFWDDSAAKITGISTLTDLSISGTTLTVDTLPNLTGTLDVDSGGTGITSFGTGVATWLGTPSSANLATAVTGETGSGALVFGTTPTFTTYIQSPWMYDSNDNTYYVDPNSTSHLAGAEMGVPGGNQAGSIMDINYIGSTSGYGIEMQPQNGGASYPIYLNNVSGVFIGGAYQNTGTTVQWLTTSDRRLKENIVPTIYGLDTLRQVQVHDFNFIGDLENPMQGFISQELYEVYPFAVGKMGDGDGTEPLGTSTPWGVDYGKLTPLLAQSIQDIDMSLTELFMTGIPGATSSYAFLIEDEDSFWSRLTSLMDGFADGILSIIGIHAEEGHFSDKICVGDTCVTEAELNALLQNTQEDPSPAEQSDNESPSNAGGDEELPEIEGENTGTTTPEVPPLIEEEEDELPLQEIDPLYDDAAEELPSEPIEDEGSLEESV